MYFVCVRSIRIIYIGTVYELEVIEINGACGALAHLCGMNEHESECHVVKQRIGRVAIQLRFAVSPAFPPNAGIFIGPSGFICSKAFRLKGKVVLLNCAGRVLILTTQPKTGGSSVTVPLDACSFRSIYPYADCCRGSGDRRYYSCAYTCTFCYGAAVSEIVVEFQRMRAHADRFIVIYTYDFRRLNAASAVVGCS